MFGRETFAKSRNDVIEYIWDINNILEDNSFSGSNTATVLVLDDLLDEHCNNKKCGW